MKNIIKLLFSLCYLKKNKTTKNSHDYIRTEKNLEFTPLEELPEDCTEEDGYEEVIGN